jgi:hypothetical protein
MEYELGLFTDDYYERPNTSFENAAKTLKEKFLALKRKNLNSTQVLHD